MINYSVSVFFKQLFDLDNAYTDTGKFVHFYMSQSIKDIRITYVLATFLFCIFGILDNYLAPESKYQIWLIRYVFVTPVLIFGFLFTFSKSFVRYSQLSILLTCLCTNLAIVLMISCTFKDELACKYYYSGILLTLYANSIFKLKFELGLIVSMMVIGAYNLVASSFGIADTIELAILIGNNFFLISAFIISSWISNSSEKLFYKTYVNRKELHEEKDQLTKSKDELKESNRAKSKIISIISHDLRNPINSLKGVFSLYNNEIITDLDFKRIAKDIESSLESTSLLISNLLNWSIISIENNAIEKKLVSARQLVGNVFKITKLQADQKSLLLINNVQQDLMIEADPDMIELVLRNLISNSIKFTERGKVEVKAHLRNETVQIVVEDTGRGISEEVASRIFNWHVRNSTQGTQSEKGSGVGLLLCKEFVQKHGGNLFFESDHQNGTRFYIQLPQSKLKYNIVQEAMQQIF